MDKFVLRWQYGLFNEDVKIHYTYGAEDTLREKAKILAENDKILVITLDKIVEVLKDTREQKIVEHLTENVDSDI